MKTYRITANIIIIGLFCTLMAWYYGRATEGNHASVIKIVSQKVPMSIRELQTFLNKQYDPWGRYLCDVDGRMGPKTLTAWDNYVCDRQAIKEFK